jgi:hypothetical protein
LGSYNSVRGCERADGRGVTIFSLRFTGGPLDGRTQPTETPAYEYRVVGGVYRRSRTHSRSATDGEPVIVYAWRPEEAERWHVPASRDADGVKAPADPSSVSGSTG